MNKISVILPTRNRNKYLYKCLLSLSKQSMKPFEVIIADNNSTDNTKEIINKFSKSLNIKYVFVKIKGISKTRNSALKIVSGKIIAFIDDDCFAHKNWIKNIHKNAHYLSNHYILGFNHNFYNKNIIANYVFFSGLADVINNITVKQNRYYISNYLDTKNAIISKKQLDLLTPIFNEKFDLFHFGEDKELGIRLTKNGFTGIIIPKIKVSHRYINSFWKFCKKRILIGRSIVVNQDILKKSINNTYKLNNLYEKHFEKEVKDKILNSKEINHKNIMSFLVNKSTKNSHIQKIQYKVLSIIDRTLFYGSMNYQKLYKTLKKI